MALTELRRPENAEGSFFVDTSCIDCDLCRQIAPDTFRQEGEQSIVYRQPVSPAGEFKALQALVTCPTASIGSLDKKSIAGAVSSFPESIDEEVYFCGFAAEASFGASSYLIVRQDGNVLVDSPRFNNPLAERIQEMGGVRWMFLTHRDDVADHDSWARRFKAERILHRADAAHLQGRIERLLDGAQPVSLAPELLVIPTPGHTRGHTVLLYRNKYLFSGDHLWWSERYRGLHASRGVNWYSWPEQLHSVRALLDYSFEWVLPGHGRRCRASAPEMRSLLEKCLARLHG